MALKFGTENAKGNNSPEGLHLLTSNSNQISFLTQRYGRMDSKQSKHSIRQGRTMVEEGLWKCHASLAEGMIEKLAQSTIASFA